MNNKKPPIESALEVMQQHISALNAGDSKRLSATLHFPHFRLSGNAMSIWKNPEHYLRDFHARAGEDWCYSAFSDIQVLQASENKVHLDVEILRYRADNTLITRFRSLWVIVEINEVWAAKFRSSFASK